VADPEKVRGRPPVDFLADDSLSGSVQLTKPDAAWHSWAPDSHSEIIERALDQVGVSDAEKEKCRGEIGKLLFLEPIEMYHLNNDEVLTWHPRSNKKERQELRNLSNALEKAQRALGALSTQWQEVLFTSRTDNAKIAESGITWPLARERLSTFQATMAKVSERAGKYVNYPESYLAAGPGELAKRVDGRKRHAANCAYDLLMRFGKPPTLSPDGPFYTLASILYEAFSGIAERGVERQCRAAHKSRRGKRRDG
jgi:hypothetical protein